VNDCHDSYPAHRARLDDEGGAAERKDKAMPNQELVRKLSGTVAGFDALIRVFEEMRGSVQGDPSFEAVGKLADVERDLVELRKDRDRWAGVLESAKTGKRHDERTQSADEQADERLDDDGGPPSQKG